MTIIILAAGCISDNPNLSRISKRLPFIIQLGARTQFVPGANTGNDLCEDIVVDRFENNICVGSTNEILGEAPASPLTTDSIIAKFDKSGNLLWVFQLGAVTSIGDNLGSDSCSGLVVDQSGNIYCGGDASSAIGTLVHGVGGGVDAFVLKLSPEGDLQWISRLGSAGDDYCASLTSDGNGNLYCGGSTTGNLGNRVNGAGTETNGGLQDAFIAKLSPSGSLTWITQIGFNSRPTWQSDGTTLGNTVGDDICRSVVVDPSGAYVYCAGATTDSLGEPNLTGPADTDIFFLRLNSSDGRGPRSIQYGLFTNAGPFTHAGNETCRKLTTDSAGNLYCVGFTTGSIADTLSGAQDVVIAKVNAGFTKGPIWQYGATNWTLGNPGGIDEGRDITVDRQSNLVISGYTSGNFGETHGGGTNDAFVLKLTTSGTPIWIRHFGQETMGSRSSGTEAGYGITTDIDNNVYMTGQTNGEFGETNGDAGGTTFDIFVLRLFPSGSL